MEKGSVKNIIFLIIPVAAVFGVIVALNCMFPLTCDDWYWATREFSFASLTELNGRYLGSALAMLLTRVTWLRTIICALFTVLCIYFVSAFSEGSRGAFFLLAAALFFIMPLELFSETSAWASGFANYIPSAAVVLWYVATVKREFTDETPSYGKAMPFISAAVGFFGAFFMETVTLGNVVVGAAILIYHLIKFKKPEPALIAFLGGAIIGAVLMSIDTAYGKVLAGTDSYRTVSIDAVWDAYIDSYHAYLIYDNFFLNVVLVISATWLAGRRIMVLKKPARALIVLCAAVQACYLVISGIEYFGVEPPHFKYLGAFKGGLSLLYFLSLVGESLVSVQSKGVKTECLFLFCCILLYTLPLLVVTPIKQRAFIYSYFLFSSIAVILISESIKTYEVKSRIAIRGVAIFSLCVIIGFSALYLIKYARIDGIFTAREERISEFLKEGGDELKLQTSDLGEWIGIKELSYVYKDEQIFTYDKKYFQAYYNIPDDVLIVEG